MVAKKNIFIIIGSASKDSSNQKLVDHLVHLMKEEFKFTIYNDLKLLPHFDPELSGNNPPPSIMDFRNVIDKADGVIICTPEYVFSIPSGLKNAIEWCVSTTIFSDKPVGLITASADGQKGHEELQLIMKTLMAKWNDDTSLLVSGIKGKFNKNGEIIDIQLIKNLKKFAEAFEVAVKNI